MFPKIELFQDGNGNYIGEAMDNGMGGDNIYGHNNRPVGFTSNLGTFDSFGRMVSHQQIPGLLLDDQDTHPHW